MHTNAIAVKLLEENDAHTLSSAALIRKEYAKCGNYIHISTAKDIRRVLNSVRKEENFKVDSYIYNKLALEAQKLKIEVF